MGKVKHNGIRWLPDHQNMCFWKLGLTKPGPAFKPIYFNFLNVSVAYTGLEFTI